MRKQLISEIANQLSLIRFLTEGVIGEFVEGLKKIITIGVSETATKSSLRSIFDTLPADIRSLLVNAQGVKINSLDELFEDLKRPYTKNGVKNTEKIVDDAIAEKIVNHFQKTIFGNAKYEKLGDLVIDNFFDLQGIDAATKSKWNSLINYAVSGDETNFFKLKNLLRNNFDNFFLEYAQKKLKKKVVDEITDEPTWFEKIFKDFFAGVGKAASGSVPFRKGYAAAATNAAELEQLMSKFFVLLDNIQTKSSTIGSSVYIDAEVRELNEIAYKISLLKDRSLKILWSQWRDNLPDFVKARIKSENIANDETFIKYVKYFESATGNGEVYSKPRYITTRLQAFVRIFPFAKNTEKLTFGHRIWRSMERLFNGAFAGDFRTWKEMAQAFEVLEKSPSKAVGFFVFERLLSYFVYVPIFWGGIKTGLSAWEKEEGFVTEPDPDNPGKLRLKKGPDGKPIPKFNIPFADGTDFLSDKNEGAKAFFEVWGLNVRRQMGIEGDFVKAGGIISPVGADWVSQFLNSTKIKSNGINDEDLIRQQEAVRQDSLRRVNDARKTADSIKNAQLRQKVLDSLDVIKRGIDSVAQMGDYRKIDQYVNSDSVNF